jgi:hypothetical protein
MDPQTGSTIGCASMLVVGNTVGWVRGVGCAASGVGLGSAGSGW